MQPDQQNNYWKPDPESDEVTEMYTPSEDGSESDQEVDENNQNDSVNSAIDDEPVHWSAKEYIPGQKNWIWFILFAFVILGLIAADFFFIKSYTFSILVVVMGASLIVYTQRPPKEIDYTLSGDQGLYIGEKLYHFSEFKAFGLLRDKDQHSIMLIPIKRFALGVSVYFPEEAGERIVDILGARLPMETMKIDLIDNIVRKLRL